MQAVVRCKLNNLYKSPSTPARGSSVRGKCVMNMYFHIFMMGSRIPIKLTTVGIYVLQCLSVTPNTFYCRP